MSADGTEAVAVDAADASPLSCSSALQVIDSPKEAKPTVTLVAVCFDGSKFTCGFEKCGMTFSRARDVQRHLKCAHPEHLKLEDREYKKDKERGSKSRRFNKEADPGAEKKPSNGPSTSFQHEEGERKTSTHPQNPNPNSSGAPPKTDSLQEILIKLSKLDLNCPTAQTEPAEANQGEAERKEPQPSHEAIIAKPPVVLLQKPLPRLSTEKVKDATENVKITTVESLANAKPYACEVENCGFRTAQSYSLLRHYHIKHGQSVSEAKTLTSLKTTAYKPYVCNLCSKIYREKQALKYHYIHMHNVSGALVDKINCISIKEEKKDGSLLLPCHRAKVRKKEIPESPQQRETNAPSVETKTPEKVQEGHRSEEEAEDESVKRAEGDKRREEEEESKDGKTQQIRSTRRLVTKNNLCYILDRYSKPFHCVAKNCDAAFSTQGGLVRHLQLVHHYNRSQLLLEKDFERRQEVQKEPAKKRPLPNSDEPQPQYKCHFANCNTSYHLKSSLVRHTRDSHSQPPELIQCKYEGCTRVFSHDDALKKHILYSHDEFYDSLVVRLQSTHKKSISGCQKKLIVAPPKEEPVPTTTKQAGVSSPRPEEEGEEGEEEEEAAKPEEVVEKHVTKSKRKINYYNQLDYRSHEEALQMCQDKCLPVAFPCMVRSCDSVVGYNGSLRRHYRNVHHMSHRDLDVYQENLFFTAELLEELIQRKSATPAGAVAAACTNNGVHKMEYQSEVKNQGNQTAPMSLHSIKKETQDEKDPDPLGFPEEEGGGEPLPVERKGVLVDADEVLYGEPSTGGHGAPSAAAAAAATQKVQKQEERLSLDQIKPLLRTVTVDLSPPCSLHFMTGEGFHDVAKDGVRITNGSAPSLPPPVRQPLKRKNELSEQPSNFKEPQSPSQHPFDAGAYKPLGYEASFLKFIQEASPVEKLSPVQLRRRDTFRSSCSVKENNNNSSSKQLGISQTRSRRSHAPLLKPHAMTGDLTSVQNLKSILDKALAGCGDLAIKQLQYLRPVVVLGRPVCTTTRPELFPSDGNNSKLVLGS